MPQPDIAIDVEHTDAFTRPEHFRAMEPRIEEWQKVPE